MDGGLTPPLTMAAARRIAPAALALLVSSAPAIAQPLAWSGEVSLGSDLSERGLSPWPGVAVVQGLVVLADAFSWSASLAAAKPLGSGDGSRGSQLVARGAAYAALSPDWLAQGRLSGYTYPGIGFRGYDRAEATLGLAYRDLVSLEASIARPDDEGSHWYPAVDLGLRWPLAARWALAAGLGRAELAGWPGTHYRYADLGLVWHDGAWRASLSRLGASGEARHYLGDAAGPRTVFSLTHAF